MKTVNRLAIIIALLLFLFSSILSCITTLAAEDTDQVMSNRFNIVLVIDASTSLAYNNDGDPGTDPDELRFQAIGEFIALLAERGNKIGSVVFNGGIVDTHEMTDADGASVKKSILEWIKSQETGGYTNIGLALETAEHLLETGANPDELPSVILLFTDGNTALEDDDLEYESLQKKADAVEAARGKYPIYTICLNANGEADSTEMKQIADGTGGQFKEVTDAEQLEDVFRLYYEMIFSSTIQEGDYTPFPDDGMIIGNFEVPSAGVEEVSIRLSCEASDYTIRGPGNYNELGQFVANRIYTKKDLSPNTYIDDNYTVIKLIDPESGKYEYEIMGNPGETIKIDIIYTPNIEAKMSVLPAKDNYNSDDDIVVSVVLQKNGKEVNGDDYASYYGTTDIIDKTGKTVISENMEKTQNGFRYDLSLARLQQRGSYTIITKITEQYGLLKPFECSAEININNNPPTKIQDINEKYSFWPWQDRTRIIDLSKGAKDPDGDVLTYSAINPTVYGEDEYEIEGSNLIMKSYSLSKGSLTIEARDTDGGTCSFIVSISTRDNARVYGTILTILLIAILAIIAILLIFVYSRRIYGIIHIQEIDSTAPSKDQEKKEKQYDTRKSKKHAIYLNKDIFGFRPDQKLSKANCRVVPGGLNGKKAILKAGCFKKISVNNNMAQSIELGERSISRYLIKASPDANKGFYIWFERTDKNRR